MGNNNQLVRFDWAIKRLLRDKANFVVLEGFLTVVLKEKVTIQRILSSESNKDDDNDKYNNVDLLIENSSGELIIVEIQNTKQLDYFQRILFGASKVITEYISEGDAYQLVKKVISITVAYFDLGQGQDYVYHGTTNFRGLHHDDILTLSEKQTELFSKMAVSDIFPEYWIIKAGNFDEDKIYDKLDEWIYFLKTGRVEAGFTAPGLPEAVSRLDKMQLTPEERTAYNEYVDRLRKLASYFLTEKEDVKDAIKDAALKGKIEGKIEMLLAMQREGLSIELMSKFSGLSKDEILLMLSPDQS